MLLRSGRVEARVLPNAAFGLIHGKAGVITYADGRKTSFLGSMNETAEAWTQHYKLVWEDDGAEAVAWVEEEFAALWNHRDARKLSDAIAEDVERILARRLVAVSHWTPAGKEPAPFIEAPVARQGAGLAPHQQAFVSQVAREIATFGQARYLLADDVGLGKTLQLGMAAQYVALVSDKPVLILASKNLLQQWQDELRNMLAVPSARWDRGRWITEDGAVWPAPADACPRRIGIFPTSLITARSPSAEPLMRLRYGCIDILNLRYRGSVEDDVYRALSHRLKDIRDVFGTLPDTLEDVWVLAAEGEMEEAKRRVDAVPRRHPFALRYTESVPATGWNRCEQVLNRADMIEHLKRPWGRR